MARYCDQNTLYVGSGPHLTQQQLSSVLDQSLKLASAKLNRPFKSEYAINVVCDNKGNYLKHCYVWVSNPEFYQVLLGKNTDGSQRVIEKEAPSPKVLSPTATAVKDATAPSLVGTGKFVLPKKSWADLEEEDEQENVSPKMVRIPAGPLFEIPQYEYNTEQLAKIKANEEPVVEGKDVKSPIGISSPSNTPVIVTENKMGSLYITAAFVCDLESKFSTHTLSCRGLPQWVTADDLRKLFGKYGTPGVAVNDGFVQKGKKGKVVNNSFPQIVIRNGGLAFITFKAGTRTAQFALLMYKRVHMKKTDASGAKEGVFWFGPAFSHS